MDQGRTALCDQLRSQGQGPGKGPAGWASAAQPGDTASAPSTRDKRPLALPSIPSGARMGWVLMCWLLPWRCRTCAGGIAPKAIPVLPKHLPHSRLDRDTRSHGVSGARGQGGTCQRRCRGRSDHTGWLGGDTGRRGSD